MTEEPDPDPAVVHLLGYPGTGKRTIAEAMVGLVPRDDQRLVMVDNHLTSQAILSALDSDGEGRLDPRVWDHVSDMRPPVFAAIAELAPPGRSYVFTNYATTDKVPETIERTQRLADERSSRYVPVILHCEVGELRRRVVEPDRVRHRKLRNPDVVAEDVASRVLVRPDSRHLLDLDVTHLSPAEAARRILAHAGLAPV